ncbi:Hydroperoxy fatty acid reductase gpx2 [Planctomycetes bacterium MalM25]|nr:Hydroperoxy fatty acid reductase gpx2 [Planctomycetes bacterium MalM25]
MIRLTTLLALLALVAPSPAAETVAPAALDFSMETLHGEPVTLSEAYAGKVVLFVNVASKCGFTRQYEGLQELHARYGEQGLAIVGVPCNQFGGQEPGTADQIAEFCSATYGVEFDMLQKVDVKGAEQCPLYAYLTGDSPYPGKVKWNFEKFLVSKEGEVVGRFNSRVEPLGPELTMAIEKQLAK